MNLFNKKTLPFTCCMVVFAIFISVITATGAVRDIPNITKDPESITVVEGATATFSIVTTGTVPLSYHWQKNGQAVVPASNTPSYTMPSVVAADSGVAFRCIVSNAEGSDTSRTAILTVTLRPPVITRDPGNVTVTNNAPAAFSVEATGTNRHYIWQKNGIAITGVADAPTITIPNVTNADNGARVRCIVFNSGGRDTSGQATITIALDLPVITVHPVNDTVTDGGTATFTITATGTALHYKWRKNNVDIAGAADNPSYTTPAVTMADHGAKYRCVVSNSSGSVPSNEALLTVTAIPPRIHTDLRDTIISEGQNLTLRAFVNGSKPLTYAWYKNDSIKLTATADTFRIVRATIADSVATYTYRVSNSAGADTSRAATVRVRLGVPIIQTQPRSVTARENTTASFTVSATGSNLQYQWRKGAVALTDTNSRKPTYTTLPVSFADNGAVFSCVVTNTAGSDTSNAATLTVLKLLPIFSKNPLNDTVKYGDTALFKVSVQSKYPPLALQWQRSMNGRNFTSIAGATDSILRKPAVGDSINNTYYRCVAADSAGRDTSLAAMMVVVYPAPTITVDPKPLTVKAGDTAVFKISVVAFNTVTFTWQYDSLGTIRNVGGGGVRDSLYRRKTVLSDNEKKFRCIVSNNAGKDTSAFALLQVSEKTSIDNQPKTTSLPLLLAGPLPATGMVAFSFSGTGSAKGHLTILDAVGSVVFEKECVVDGGSRTFLTWDCTSRKGRRAAGGSYIALLKIRTSSGAIETYTRLISIKEAE